MRILLDECVDRRLGRELAGHDVSTVPQMGWAARRNGERLAASQNSFDAFVTVDRNLSIQQDLTAYAIAVIVLRATSNRLRDLRPLVPALLAVLGTAPKGQATVVGLVPPHTSAR